MNCIDEKNNFCKYSKINKGLASYHRSEKLLNCISENRSNILYQYKLHLKFFNFFTYN